MNKIQDQDIQKNKTAKIDLPDNAIGFIGFLGFIGKMILSILIIGIGGFYIICGGIVIGGLAYTLLVITSLVFIGYGMGQVFGKKTTLNTRVFLVSIIILIALTILAFNGVFPKGRGLDI